jgi:iron complex outermembrane recepter protein
MKKWVSKCSVRTAGLKLGCCLLALSASTYANAQRTTEDAGTGLEDIIVTATKRVENLQDVPVAAIAYSGDQLRARGIVDAADLSLATPGLTFNATAGWTGKINYTLRGVGLNNFQEANEAAVAVYQDETYIASLVGSMVSAFDLERVEVLKGPQGTLFGRSASGGLVHFISAKPTFDDSGFVNASYGKYNQMSIDAALNTKLSDQFALRFSARMYRHDGWLQNSLGPDQNADEQYVIRGQLAWKPSETVTNILKVERGSIGAKDGVGFVWTGLNETTGRVLPSAGPDAQGYRRTRGFFTVDSELRTNNDIKRWFVQNQLTADLGFATLSSNTAYIDIKKNYLEDNDMGPRPFLIVPVLTTTSQWLQELRLSSADSGPFKWTAGVFYFNWKLWNNIPLIFGDPTSTVFGNFRQDTIVNQRKESFAGYGQASYAVNEQLEFTLGARVERENVSFSLDQGNFAGAFGPSTGVVPVYNPALNGDALRIRKTYGSGGIGINYRPSERTLIYLTAKRGIKPGGFNAPFFGRPPASAIKFREEKLDAFEAGFKTELFDRHLRLNASAFYYDYKDYQATQFSVLGTFTGNAKARIYGLDVDATAKLNKHIELGMNASLLDAKATVSLAPPRGITQVQMPQAPKLALTTYLQLSTEMFGGTLSTRADLKYQSAVFFDIRNEPGLRQKGYAVADIRVDWTNERYRFGAFMRNVTNEKYAVYIGDGAFAGYGNVTPGKPQWWGLEAGYRW